MLKPKYDYRIVAVKGAKEYWFTAQVKRIWTMFPSFHRWRDLLPTNQQTLEGADSIIDDFKAILEDE